MTMTAGEKLLLALCDPTVSTAEAVSEIGADADLLAVRKPSRDNAPPDAAGQLERDCGRKQPR